MTSAVQSSRLGRSVALPPPRHLASTMVLATLLVLYLIAGLNLASTGVEDGRAAARTISPANLLSSPRALGEALPAPEPLAFRDLTPEQAALFNATVPISDLSNPAARPFAFNPVTETDRLRAIDCLTAAVYYEAAIEPLEGQRAVAQVVLNRVRHPAFPKTVCGVVFEGSQRATGCQFTFTCDGSLARRPSLEGWERARRVAEEALAGKVHASVGYATHYHTYWVVPYWSATLTKLANVGAHIFYRWEGGWGRPPAFRFAATGTEPEVAMLRHLSSVQPQLAETEAELPGAVSDPVAVAGGLVTQADLKDRAVVRRYEPLRAESVAKARAELAKADVPKSLRWALTGEGKPVEGPLAGVRMKQDGEVQNKAAAPSPPSSSR